jgi:hypothetical protein
MNYIPDNGGEPEVVIRLAEEERPRLLPTLVKAGLMFPLMASSVIAQAHALKVKKDFSPGEELIKARFYLLADLAEEFKSVYANQFSQKVEAYLSEGRSLDEAVRLAEQEIESEINSKYSDDQVAFDLVVLSTSQSGSTYEITIDPVFIDLKYKETPYPVGDPDYPEGGLHHLKYHTYGLVGDTVQVEACHTNCYGNCYGDCYGDSCHSDCHTDCHSDCHNNCHSNCDSFTCQICYTDTFCVSCHTNCHTDSLPPDVSHHKPPVSECPTPVCPNDIGCHANCYGCYGDCYTNCYTDLRCYGDCYSDCYSNCDCYDDCDCYSVCDCVCYSDCHSECFSCYGVCYIDWW